MTSPVPLATGNVDGYSRRPLCAARDTRPWREPRDTTSCAGCDRQRRHRCHSGLPCRRAIQVAVLVTPQVALR